MRGAERLVVAALAAFACTTAVSGASAHGPSLPAGYVSTVIEIRPPVLGLSARVLGGDDLLSVRNWSNRTVVVLDPDGRPMFRLRPDGVYRRGAGGWRLLKRGTSYWWHDPRIHWNGSEPPAAVARAPDQPHQLGSWRVAALVDGQRVAIRGVMGWNPEPLASSAAADELPRWAVPAMVACSVAALAALLVVPVLARRRPS